jgi:hypothetical protein
LSSTRAGHRAAGKTGEAVWQQNGTMKINYKILSAVLASAGCVVLLSGCTTAVIYQSPVSQFRTSVNCANDGIRTYLLGVNHVIARGSLYTEYRRTTNWVTADLANGIPDREIRVRLQALNTISAYANALGAMAESKDVANLQQAAQTLGTNINVLDATIKSLGQKNQWSIDLGDPVAALIGFFGTIDIEHRQKAALEKAIIEGSTNVDAIIESLKRDAKIFSPVISAYEDQIWAGKLANYDKLLKTAEPKEVDSLVNECLADYDSIQSLKNAQMTSLLDDMECSHKALVVFANSSKRPKDLSDLADQIDVFTAHVQLFNNALSSIQQAINPPK